MSILNVDTVNATSGLVPASYTTQNLPVGVNAGTIVFDSTENTLKVFDGFSWKSPKSESIVAIGGNSITTSRGYKTHVFTSNGIFNVTNGGIIEYLIVAGGGAGGGGDVGGGGGAGGLLYGHTLISSASYTVTTGAGGTGNASSTSYGGKGSDSSFGNLIAFGGGGGGGWSAGQNIQSSGGSGGASTSSNRTGFGITGQGNNAGFPGRGSPNYPQAGGGGAGSPGQPAPNNFLTGRGGDGRIIPIISSTLASQLNVGEVISSQVWFAGGGSGGVESGQNADTPVERGGYGGGGRGGRQVTNLDAIAGKALTGGGGGGEDPQPGANGGSGVVIIRYRV